MQRLGGLGGFRGLLFVVPLRGFGIIDLGFVIIILFLVCGLWFGRFQRFTALVSCRCWCNHQSSKAVEMMFVWR